MAIRRVGGERVVAFRLRAGHLDDRLPAGPPARAACLGLQDGSPRSAVLSLAARVEGVAHDAWADPAFVQIWGPRGAVFVVALEDLAVFTFGLLPRDRAGLDEADAAATKVLRALRRGSRVRELPILSGRDKLLACATGRVRIRWDTRDTLVLAAEPPDGDPEGARLELVRRYLEQLGPSTAEDFALWSGVSTEDATATFARLQPELVEVHAAGRRSWIRAQDEPALADAEPIRGVRLLPPGDPYLLARDRDVLEQDPLRRAAIWPASNVWPGALLVDGRLVGTWRRSRRRFTIDVFEPLSPAVRGSVEAEAAELPFPPEYGSVRVVWRDGS